VLRERMGGILSLETALWPWSAESVTSRHRVSRFRRPISVAAAAGELQLWELPPEKDPRVLNWPVRCRRRRTLECSSGRWEEVALGRGTLGGRHTRLKRGYVVGHRRARGGTESCSSRHRATSRCEIQLPTQGNFKGDNHSQCQFGERLRYR
jgi:hypothetical protein